MKLVQRRIRTESKQDRLLLFIGRAFGTRVLLSVGVATIVSSVLATVIAYLVRGYITWHSPVIGAICCFVTALPVHLFIRGYYNLVQKKNEDLLVATQEVEELNQKLSQENFDLQAFSRRVAHELRNPLSVVIGNAHLLRSELDENEAKGVADDIVISSEGALEIVDAILLLAQLEREAPFLDVYPIKPTFDRALIQLEEKIQRKQARVSSPTQWAEVFAYGPWIERVWVNLLENALKYGGEQPVIEIGIEETDDHVHCWVHDNGPGLSEERQNDIFREFNRVETSAETGFGLGLPMIARLLQRMNGRIQVQSKLGEGARFSFYLPVLGVRRRAVSTTFLSEPD